MRVGGAAVADYETSRSWYERDALVADIAARGLDPTVRETYGNGVRKATYRDPDGNEIGGAPL